jgi:uncharacterized membrane protein YfcA
MKKPMELTTSLVITLIVIGLMAGMLSGFVGVGGGLIIVPALIWLLNFNQFQAQGTSLAVLLLPVGILAVMNYYKAGHVDMPVALVIGAAFIAGAFAGSRLALKLPEDQVKFVFGLMMLYGAVRILWSSGQKLWGS